jgi:hypothetical protein
MRVSIWQQWISNHSADFTVVGKFATQHRADQVAGEIRAMLRRIEDWWANLSPDERSEWIPQAETANLTPPEESLQKEYKIDWPFSLAFYCHQYSDAIPPVQVFERLVIVENPHPYLWHGPQPFNDLLVKLGGEVAVRAESSRTYSDTRIVASINCTAPNSEVLGQICVEVERAKLSEEIVPVWLVFHSGRRDPDEQDLLHDAEIYFKSCAHEHYDNLKRFSSERQAYLEDIMYGVRIHSAENPVMVECQELQINIEGLRFDTEHFIGLRAMIAWLKEEGCSSIDYDFEEREA